MRISDWSSDVCSSDLALKKNLLPCYLVTGDEHLLVQVAQDAIRAAARDRGFGAREVHVAGPGFRWEEIAAAAGSLSSEERGVGNECVSTCSSRRSPYH